MLHVSELTWQPKEKVSHQVILQKVGKIDQSEITTKVIEITIVDVIMAIEIIVYDRKPRDNRKED